MATVHPSITPPIAAWIQKQQMFFVATAPLDGDGHVNLSPKGLDTLRVLDHETVAYLDLTGSGAETIAHVRENGRITLMWCAFEGAPRTVRVHGRGEIVAIDEARVAGLFPAIPGARSVILVHAVRVADSCGYAVPKYTYEGQRSKLIEWAERRGPTGSSPTGPRRTPARSTGSRPSTTPSPPDRARAIVRSLRHAQRASVSSESEASP